MTGQVQGVGFRPYVWSLATRHALAGFVCNDSGGVIVEIEGPTAQVEAFLDAFPRALPPLARLDGCDVEEVSARGEARFIIRASSMHEGASSPVAPDVCVCAECLQEMRDHRDRRYRYPFINCTNCGPRFTIVEDVPYDRTSTTMKGFVMCDRCQREYDDPGNRRFHAQPNACWECGPRVWFARGLDEAQGAHPAQAAGDGAIAAFSEAVAAGRIVAVKGIGGFHLACHALDVEAVHVLRQRKGRGDKPLAVMVRDLAHVAELAEFDEQEAVLLSSSERPIVLLKKRDAEKFEAAMDAVAPGNDYVGVMLPYSPLHFLLTERVSPLVMTSGNLTDEPIASDNDDAIERLAGIADDFLFHDREIHQVCDDSVVRCLADGVLPVRRSRGYAPMPIPLTGPSPRMLAVGGEIKAAFCVTKDRYAYLSQHIGDLGNLETLATLERSVRHFLNLFRIEPEVVVADLHPDYLSGRWAAELANATGLSLHRVQHHAAHAAALAAEHRLAMSDVMVACTFDGTGFGFDGAIWGGEFLQLNGADAIREAHMQYFPLPGGEACIQRPYRTALAALYAAGIPWDERLPCVAACNMEERRVLRRQLERRVNCVDTSSVGRLFDAVSSVVGVRQRATYEGQAAMEFETLASRTTSDARPDRYDFSLLPGDPLRIDWRPLLRDVVTDVLAGVDATEVAADFHIALARMIGDVCQRIAERRQTRLVGLTGGVFQNILLSEMSMSELRKRGLQPLRHHLVPPNDGGLALGQVELIRRKTASV
ncbi:MAG: carbamoyltransferase HypF [Planctomycetales bacterium]|nr:carbamoyltransferase HypF [Planctomycetales bacterium]